ncbi:hypothetical protein N431DRAFT_417104 [Stipitochalara longipes BDJ]|nr:hypothetical protein N431DRAFT_417104 [Stipitochalara longipes BDJ]
MTAAMIFPTQNIPQATQSGNAFTPRSTPYSPTNPHHLPLRQAVRPTSLNASCTIDSKKQSPTSKNKIPPSVPTSAPPIPSMQTAITRSSESVFVLAGSISNSTTQSFVPQNKGVSFTFAPSLSPYSSTAPPATNPYAGLNEGMTSWRAARPGINAKQSTDRPRANWRNNRGTSSSDAFAAEFPDLASIPQFGQMNALNQTPFSPSESTQLYLTMPPTNDEVTKASKTNVLPIFYPGSGAAFKFSAQARLNPGHSPGSNSRIEKTRSTTRNRAGKAGKSLEGSKSRLSSSFAPQIEQFIGPQPAIQQNIPASADESNNSTIGENKADTNLSKNSGAEVVQSAGSNNGKADTIAPLSTEMEKELDALRLQVSQHEMAITDLESEHRKEQEVLQTQEIADLKAALAVANNPAGKYGNELLKDETIRHQTREIERLTKCSNGYEKSFRELSEQRRAARRSQREFGVLERQIKSLEGEKSSLEKKFKKDVDDTEKRVGKMRARHEEKRLEWSQREQSLIKQLRQAKTKDNYTRVVEAEKENMELLEKIGVLEQSNEESQAAVKTAKGKTKKAEEEQESMAKGFNSQLAENTELVAVKDALVAEKDGMIMELKGIIEKKKQTLEELGADSAARKIAEVEDLKVMVKEKDRVIEILDGVVLALMIRNDQLRDELKEKFTPKLDAILMKKIEPLPTLKRPSISPSLVGKLTAIVATDNAACPLSISKLMVTDIRPSTSEIEFPDNNISNDDKENKDENGVTESQNNSPDDSIDGFTFIAANSGGHKLFIWKRILFFVSLTLIALIAATFQFFNQLSGVANSVRMYVVSFSQHEIPAPDVILRDGDKEVFVLNPTKLDLPFKTTETAEYIDIVIDLTDIIDNPADESEFNIMDNIPKPETQSQTESDPVTESEIDLDVSSKNREIENQLDMMFISAAVTLCILVASYITLEKGL